MANTKTAPIFLNKINLKQTWDWILSPLRNKTDYLFHVKNIDKTFTLKTWLGLVHSGYDLLLLCQLNDLISSNNEAQYFLPSIHIKWLLLIACFNKIVTEIVFVHTDIYTKQFKDNIQFDSEISVYQFTLYCRP